MSIKLPRISIPKEFHHKYKLYSTLDEKQEGEVFRFSTMADMVVIAAIIGFYIKRYKPFIESDKVEKPFKWDVFINNEYHIQIIKSIVLLHIQENPKDAEKLLDNEEMNKIIMGYANGGIHHLINKLEDGVDIEGNIINLIKDYNKLTLNIDDF